MVGYYEWLKKRHNPSATACDAGVDWVAHDKHFHGGHYDSKTMTCKLRAEYDAKMADEDIVRIESEEENENGRHEKGEGRGSSDSNEFDRLCRESEGLSEEARRDFASGGRKLSEGEFDHIAEVLGRRLGSNAGGDNLRSRWVLKNPKTKEDVEVFKVNGKSFRECFAVCRNYLRNGDQVDLHDPEFYDHGFGIIRSDGTAGFFINDEGDAVSGFSLQPKSGKGKAFFPTIAPLMKKYARTTDCFKTKSQDLPGYYEKTFGFQTASRLAFNYDILAESHGKEYADWFVKTYGESDVYFMVNSSEPIEQKDFPKEDWDGAYAYQQACAPKKKS